MLVIRLFLCQVFRWQFQQAVLVQILRAVGQRPLHKIVEQRVRVVVGESRVAHRNLAVAGVLEQSQNVVELAVGQHLLALFVKVERQQSDVFLQLAALKVENV